MESELGVGFGLLRWEWWYFRKRSSLSGGRTCKVAGAYGKSKVPAGKGSVESILRRWIQ